MEPDADTLTDFKTMLLRRDGGGGDLLESRKQLTKHYNLKHVDIWYTQLHKKHTTRIKSE